MRALVFVLVTAGLSHAQTAPFEVASVKPAAFPNEAFFSGYTSGGGACNKPAPRIEGNRVTFLPASICGLIRVAYDVQSHQIAGIPQDMLKAEQANYYDVVAQAAEDRALTLDQAREMLQSLLAERFGLKLRRETGERPVYVLTVHRGGLKMSTEPLGNCVNGRPPASMRGTGFGNCQPAFTMAMLVENLLRYVDRPLIDRTELTGKYAFFLMFTLTGMNNTGPNAAPELPTALQEQLGLRLEVARAPIEVLVVEQVKRASEN